MQKKNVFKFAKSGAKDFEKIIWPLIKADNPKTPNILNIFDPTTFPIAIVDSIYDPEIVPAANPNA